MKCYYWANMGSLISLEGARHHRETSGATPTEVRIDARNQRELRTQLGKMTKKEALAARDPGSAIEDALLTPFDLRKLDITRAERFQSIIAEKVIYDACASDLKRRGLATTAILGALNNYIQLTKQRLLDDKPRATKTYTGTETREVLDEVNAKKIEILSKILGDERERIDGLSAHLRDKWASPAWQKEVLRSVDERQARVGIMTPAEYLKHAREIAELMFDDLPDGVTSLESLKRKVSELEELKEAEETFKAALRDKGPKIDTKTHPNLRLREMVTLHRKRVTLLSRASVQARVEVLKEKITAYLRKENLKIVK